MSPADQAELLLLALCLLLSAFFSASETAFIGADPLRLQNRAAAGDAGARRALALARHPRRLLTAVLIGNNLVNVLASALGTVVAVRHLGEQAGLAVGGALVTVVLVLFCEVAPKTWAANNAVPIASRLARPLALWLAVVGPLTRAVVWLAGRRSTGPRGSYSPDEARATVQRWASEGLLPDDESRLITAALRLREVSVKSIMTPLADLSAIPADTPAAKAVEIALREGHSRLPVYRSRLDDVVGVLHLRDAVRSEREGSSRPAWDLMRAPVFVPATEPASDVLRELQARRTALAVVTDEFGGAVGVCTVEDILEELVGEIREEHDLEPEQVRRLPDGDLIASGRATVRELQDDWGVALPEGPYRTLQGLFFSALCRMPVPGDCLEVDEIRLLVETADSKVVHRVRIRLPRAD